MQQDNITAVIGAGPYGLSIAAHLKAHGIPTLVFGKSMGFWQHMPTGLYLKSIWSASSLSAPGGAFSLNRYIAVTNTSYQEPISLPFFLDYTRWFQQQAIPNVDSTYVRWLSRDGRRFQLDLADGRIIKADKVVVAVGISLFAHVPDFACDLPAALVTHTNACEDVACFRGRSVAVVGGGQSALEYAALLYEAGADVEVIARGPVRWHSKRLYDYSGPVRRILYPPGDVGPPGINWLVAFPLFFSHLPDKIRYPLHKRAVRPAGAKWLRPRIEGCVPVTANTHVVKATAQGRGVCIELSDGTTRMVDHLILGTGYRPDVRKLPFIDPTLLEQVQEENGYPTLNRWFESSVSHLHFAGALAGNTFGPVCRFVSGAGIPALQIARHASYMK